MNNLMPVKHQILYRQCPFITALVTADDLATTVTYNYTGLNCSSYADHGLAIYDMASHRQIKSLSSMHFLLLRQINAHKTAQRSCLKDHIEN